MAETGKRVEVRCGTFACRIEGYDDPVEQMRGVLAAMQQAIAATPALTDEAPDDEQFGRIRAALADKQAEIDAGNPALVVIRNHEEAAPETEAADFRTDRTGDAPEARAADAGPHATGGLFAAPAAAAAEAAFAAGMAAGDGVPPAQQPRSEEPLTSEEPHERPTAAGTFSAPAAELAEAGFPARGAGMAASAEVDDGTGDAAWTSGEQATGEPARIDQGEDTSPAAPDIPAQRTPDAAPEEGWPGSQDSSDGPWPATEIAAGEPLPLVNIFAPPPAGLATAGAQQLTSLRREPGPAAADPDLTRDAAEAHDALVDDGAADWEEAEDGDLRGTDPLSGAPSAENRFAALITRYQSSREQFGAAETAHAAPEARISAAELAERAQAEEVSDLLAVSAAWLTLAAGRPRFSRREVMEVFETLPGEHARTLEARIKGFGRLVRSGVLVLVGDGAFALSQGARDQFRELIDQG